MKPRQCLRRAFGNPLMHDSTWSLHTQLKQDTIDIGDLPLCRVLVIKDANYPWQLLVPRRRRRLAHTGSTSPSSRTPLAGWPACDWGLVRGGGAVPARVRAVGAAPSWAAWRAAMLWGGRVGGGGAARGRTPRGVGRHTG